MNLRIKIGSRKTAALGAFSIPHLPFSISANRTRTLRREDTHSAQKRIFFSCYSHPKSQGRKTVNHSSISVVSTANFHQASRALQIRKILHLGADHPTSELEFAAGRPRPGEPPHGETEAIPLRSSLESLRLCVFPCPSPLVTAVTLRLPRTNRTWATVPPSPLSPTVNIPFPLL